MKRLLACLFIMLFSCQPQDTSVQMETLERLQSRIEKENGLLLQEIVSYAQRADQKVYLDLMETAQKMMKLRDKHELHILNEEVWQTNEQVEAYLKEHRQLLEEAGVAGDWEISERYEQIEMLCKDQLPLTPGFIMLNIAELENLCLHQIESRVAFIPLC